MYLTSYYLYCIKVIITYHEINIGATFRGLGIWFNYFKFDPNHLLTLKSRHQLKDFTCDAPPKSSCRRSRRRGPSSPRRPSGRPGRRRVAAAAVAGGRRRPPAPPDPPLPPPGPTPRLPRTASCAQACRSPCSTTTSDAASPCPNRPSSRGRPSRHRPEVRQFSIYKSFRAN